MKELTMKIGRREFTAAGVMALLSGLAITVTDCGSTSSPSSPSSTGSSGGTTADLNGVVSNNHGHTAIITSAQLKSPTDITIHMQAQATHDHLLSLTAAQVSSAASGQRVTMTSTTDSGHNHLVTFN